MRAVKGNLGHSSKKRGIGNWKASLNARTRGSTRLPCEEINQRRSQGHPRWPCAPGTRARRRMRGSRQPPFLLAEPPRYSGGRSMRAVKDGLPAPSRESKESEGPRSTAAVKSSSRPCLASSTIDSLNFIAFGTANDSQRSLADHQTSGAPAIPYRSRCRLTWGVARARGP